MLTGAVDAFSRAAVLSLSLTAGAVSRGCVCSVAPAAAPQRVHATKTQLCAPHQQLFVPAQAMCPEQCLACIEVLCPPPATLLVGPQLMRAALQDEPDTLMVVSSYHIGKERAYLGAAAALGLKVGPATHCCLGQCCSRA
jgi:hypothetical protein